MPTPARTPGSRPARHGATRGKTASNPRHNPQRSPRSDSGDEPRRNRASQSERPPREDRPAKSDRFDNTPRAGGDDRADRKNRDQRPSREQRSERGYQGVRDQRPRDDERREGRNNPRNEQRDNRPARDDSPRRNDDPRRSDDSRRDGRPARAQSPREEGDRGSRFGGQRSSGGRPGGRPGARRGAPGRSQGKNPSASRHHKEDLVQERYQGTSVSAETHAADTFGELGISRALTEVLSGMGASSPFPIQTATIPEALTGRDILARGHTGSGKTIAFGAALVERLAPGGKTAKRKGSGRAPSALILAPTRELALQIDRTVQPLARAAGLFTTQIVGGVPQGRQVQALQRGVDIVIGTPGRLEDLITQGHLSLDQVWVTVIDEADHMSELGFAEPVDRLLAQTQGGGQKLFFSATLDRAVAQLVEKFLVAPAIFELQTSDEASASIDHHVFVIDQRDKREMVQRLSAGNKKTLVFTRTRADAKNLAEHLDGLGIPAVALHGDLSQGQRQRNLGKLGSGRAQVLVATDVAARGIHVDDIALVIHADPAEEHKTYVHRSGRTGRAGSTGRVVTLATKSRQREVDSLLHRAGIEWTTTTMGLGDRALADFTAQ